MDGDEGRGGGGVDGGGVAGEGVDGEGVDGGGVGGEGVDRGERVDGVARLLRERAEVAPTAVSDRAIQRVRIERGSWLLLRALGGALLRVARATPDYVTGATRTDPEQDTGEWPAPDATPSA